MAISLQDRFANLESPRQAGKVKVVVHLLSENPRHDGEGQRIRLLQLGFITQYCTTNKQSIPTHDTIQRVFQAEKPEAIMACFGGWTQK